MVSLLSFWPCGYLLDPTTIRSLPRKPWIIRFYCCYFDCNYHYGISMSEQLIDMSPMQSVLHSFSPPCNGRNRVKEDERFPRLKRHVSFRVFIYLINLAYCKIQFQMFYSFDHSHHELHIVHITIWNKEILYRNQWCWIRFINKKTIASYLELSSLLIGVCQPLPLEN